MEAVAYYFNVAVSVISCQSEWEKVVRSMPITFSTMRREVQSLKSELRALRTGHLSTSEVRLPWTPEEKLRHESNSHAEYDNRCEICVKPSGISRHPRRV